MQLGRTLTSSILGPQRSFPVALTICILSGVLSAMFNFGYAFGGKITQAAIALGSTPDNAVNAIWLVMLPAGGKKGVKTDKDGYTPTFEGAGAVFLIQIEETSCQLILKP